MKTNAAILLSARLPLLLFAAMAAAGFGSCGKEPHPFPAAAAGRALLAWVASDNNLAGEASERVRALCRGRANAPGGELFVFCDRPSGACLLRALPDGRADTVAAYGSVDSSSPELLARVLGEVKAACREADGYGLLFFSHASGWLPYGTLGSPSRSLGWDDRPGADAPAGTRTEMELAEFAAALPDAGLDFVVFEACLMAGAEVAYALRDKAGYMLASSAEMLSPGFAPIYGSSLKYLLDASHPAAEALEAFGRAYMVHVGAQTGLMRSATLSLVDLSQMEELARSAAGWLPDAPVPVEGLQRFDRPGKYGDRPALERYFDLGQVAERFAPPAEAALLAERLRRAVPWKEATERFMISGNGGIDYGGYDIAAHSGLTVYLPREAFPTLNDAYRRTAWYGAVHADR